jgi:diacylglycerol kinase family enzyme
VVDLGPLERLAEAGPSAGAVERKRMLVIVNPHASTVSEPLRGLVLAALRSRYDLDAVDTQAQGHATELCREAAHEGYDLVAALGGDGTVNEAANGLVGSLTPLTCLPGGATNVLAKLLGIPGDLVAATEHLLRLPDAWRPRRIDLGRVNGRWFTFSSGVGLTASVVRRTDRHPHLKARLRQWYFAYNALVTFGSEYVVDPPPLAVELDGRRVEGMSLIVQNGQAFSYFYDRQLHVAEGGGLTTGTLAGAVLHRAGPVDVPGVLVRLFGAGPVTGHRRIEGFTDVRGIRCTSADGRPLALEVDGDHLGDVTEAVYDLTPGALVVVT